MPASKLAAPASVQVWVVGAVGKTGQPFSFYVQTVSSTRRRSIMRFAKIFTQYNDNWRLAYRRGWRVIRVDLIARDVLPPTPQEH